MKSEVFYANNISATGHMGANLRQFSMSLYSGEILGLFGNRHAGKGTLLQMMTGLIPITEGSIYWNGTNGTVPVVTRVKRDSAFIDDMQIWENLAILWKTAASGELLALPVLKQIIRLYLDDFGIHVDLNQKANTLSALEKVALETLMALRRNPDVLIIDLNGIEGSGSEYELLNRLLIRIREGNTGVLVSGNQAEVICMLCDRIAVIYDGRIIKEFAAGEISPGKLERLLLRLYHVEKESVPKPLMDSDCILRVTGLEIGPGEKVSFSLFQGEFVAIVSPRQNLFQILQRRVLDGEQRQTCSVRYTGTEIRQAEPGKGILFLNTRFLDALIEDMTPLENLYMGIFDRLGPEYKKLIRCMERDFYEWYGHEGILRQKDCRALKKEDRIAINLFRLRFMKVGVIFCNALNVHSDVKSGKMVSDALRELARTGVAVCMLTNDVSYRGEMVDRYVILSSD